MTATAKARPGELRERVQVVAAGDSVRVTYGIWEVRLPAAWLAEHPDFAAFLDRRAPLRGIAEDREVSAVMALLAEQGCLAPEPFSGPVSLGTVRDHLERIRGDWYATYYAHPLWNRLRTGEASRNELLAYLVHNYHVSRAAGVAAARVACRGPERWRAFFAEDAREEYWHCDEYYFVQSAALGCPDERIKTYVPLAGSTAFEQHTLQLAGRDAVASALVAYFQESSVVFQGAASEFYAEVSRAYGLSDFFRPWLAHIGIDVAENHAGGIRALLGDDVVIPGAAARCSLARTWAAFHFLCASLDDASGEARPDDEISCRDPVSGAAWLRVGGDWWTGGTDLASCTARYTDTRPCVAPGPFARADLPFLIDAIRTSALAALSAGRGHDEIMCAGRIHEALIDGAEAHRGADDGMPGSPWTLALDNFLSEAAARPLEWAVLVASLARRLALWPAASSKAYLILDRALGRASAAAAPSALVALGQLHELVDRWAVSTARFPDDL